MVIELTICGQKTKKTKKKETIKFQSIGLKKCSGCLDENLRILTNKEYGVYRILK